MEPPANIHFRESTPEILFLSISYFNIGKDYASKQPPKSGPLYLDRLHSTSSMLPLGILPLAQMYNKKNLNDILGEKSYNSSLGQISLNSNPSVNNYTSLGIGSNTYTGNSSGRSYGRSNPLGYNTPHSSYQS